MIVSCDACNLGRNNVADLPTYQVKSNEDVIAHFQSRLDQFPSAAFSEFGAVLVGNAERVDRLVFPEAIVAIPDADESIRNHQPTAFPEVRLMAEADTDNLYLKMTAQVPNDEGLFGYESVVVDIDRAFFVADIWDAVSTADRPSLAKAGLGAGMTARQWAGCINVLLADVAPSPTLANDEESVLMLRELPISILRRGAVGTNGSYHFQPQFLVHALTNNEFVYDRERPDPVHNFGNVHIHSLVNKMGELERAVANIVGPDVVRRNPSAPDVMHHRASNDIFERVSTRYGTREKVRAMYTFGGIITVDGSGRATGIRWLDFYKEGLDLQRLIELNNAAEDTLCSETPQAAILAEYYRFIDSATTTEMPHYVGAASG